MHIFTHTIDKEEDQVETVKDQVKKESRSQIEERLEQLLLEMKSMKQYQLY